MKKTTKPSKSRKRIYTAPWHIKRKLLSATLSHELREKYHTRSFPIRKGDTVRILRGEHSETEGKVIRVDYENQRIYVDKIKREKSDGTSVHIPIHPSKVMILSLDLSDERRKMALERRAT